MWRLFATVSGNYLTGSDPNLTGTLTITLDDETTFNPDALANHTLQGTGQIRANVSIQTVFADVEPGTRTIRVLALKSAAAPAVQLANGRLTVMVMGYTCA